MPTSHRRHGQDNTVLLVRVGGVNCIGDKARQFCLVSTRFPISKFSVVLSIFETKQLQIGNFVASSHRRHGQYETRQFCLVRVGGMKYALVCVFTLISCSQFRYILYLSPCRVILSVFPFPSGPLDNI